MNLGGLNVFLYQARPKSSVAQSDYRSVIATLLTSDTIQVWRSAPRGARALDARPSIWRLQQMDDGSIFIGLKSSGKAMPRAAEILQLITAHPADEQIALWDIERVGIWWEIEGELYSPHFSHCESA